MSTSSARLLSPKQVAEMLMCSRKTVERVFASGGFPNGFRSGSLMVIPESDVEAYKVRPERKPHRRRR